MIYKRVGEKMRMKIDEYIIDSYYGEYKSGVFGKKKTVSLLVYPSHIEGRGVSFYEDKIYEKEMDVDIDKLRNLKLEKIEGFNCLIIEYLDDEHIIGDSINTIAFPNLYNADEVIKKVLELKENLIKEKQIKDDTQKRLEEEKVLAEKRQSEERALYFKKSYAFHILENNNPFYELHRNNLQFACIYIDKNKSLNFLKIDGDAMEERNAVISFDKLHYYEKAGNVHYATDINGDYKNFGGCIDGATFSKKATFLGGLLLGPMGMAAGALFSQKPSAITMPSTSFNLSSEIHKIDDRSVILNYYSDLKKQFMDIELPMDIYNFLQTYLPEKKYGIVLEIEKQKAIKQHTDQLELETKEAGLTIEEKKNNIESEEEIFQNKIRKLKMMYDNGLLSDEEFAEEKRKILSQL